MINLRRYQQEALSKIVHKLVSLVVMASGLGKTIVAAFWAKDKLGKDKNARVIFLAHENYILGQALLEFKKVMPNVSMGIFTGEEKNFSNVEILFASFQTMRTWKEAFAKNDFQYLIVDEAHHSKAESYEEVIRYMIDIVEVKAHTAFTATPNRMDGQEIEDLFGEALVDIRIAEAVAKAWLTKMNYQIITDNINQSVLQKMVKDVFDKKKKISIKQLNESIFIDKRDEEIAEIIKKKVGNKKTLVFCENIKHADNFQLFLENSATYHSKNRKSKENLQLFTDNGLQFLLSVNKFNEGIDMPDIEAVVFLRSTDSETIFLQQLGRGLRLKFGKGELLVLDFVANLDRILYLNRFMQEVKKYAPKDYDQDLIQLNGEGFSFNFSEEIIGNILNLLEEIQKKTYISDVPEALKAYLGDNAYSILVGSHKKVFWSCQKCGGEVLSSVERRLIKQKDGSYKYRPVSCNICKPIVKTYISDVPEALKAYLGDNAHSILVGSHKKVFWSCQKCGGEALSSVERRFIKQKDGSYKYSFITCQTCKPKTKKYISDIPKVLEAYAGDTADKITVYSTKKVNWKCQGCGIKIVSRVKHRIRKDIHGVFQYVPITCKSCKNSIFTVPEAKKAYLGSEDIGIASTKIVAWACSTCGDKVLASVESRMRKQADGNYQYYMIHCEPCRKKSKVYISDVPKAADAYLGDLADKLSVGSCKVVLWRCDDCGDEVSSTVDSRMFKETDGGYKYRIIRCVSCKKKRRRKK